MFGGGAGPESPLWPQVEADGEGRRNGPWSKWFTRLLRGKAGITDPGKVFHSFRHTWEDLARNAKLPEDVRDTVTGQADGGVGRTYGAGFGLKVLAEEIARIEVPAAVRGLCWERDRAAPK